MGRYDNSGLGHGTVGSPQGTIEQNEYDNLTIDPRAEQLLAILEGNGSNQVLEKNASFTVSFKAKKGIAKEKRKQISTVNKAIKKKSLEFTIEPVDLTQAMNVTYELDKKGTKVKKLSLTVNGVKYNPKAKKDFTYEIGSDKIVIKGTGDYKNSLEIALKK